MFSEYIATEQLKALNSLCEEEGLQREKVDRVIRNFLYTGKLPLRKKVIECLHEPPKLTQRALVGGRIIESILSFVDTFIEGMS